MGQKVNPIGFRLGINRTWDSRWYAEAGYADLLHEDLKIREYLRTRLAQAGVSRIVIERPAKKARVTIHTARPGVVIGKKGADIEKLRAELAKMTGFDVHLNIVEIRKPEIDAQMVAENIAQQLERRVHFRRAMKRAVQSAMRLGGPGHPHQLRRPSWRRRNRPHGVVPRGPRAPAHAARQLGLWHDHREDDLRHLRRQGVDIQGRDHGPRPDGPRQALRRPADATVEPMLNPKRTKFRKAHKGRIHGVAKGGSRLNFGSYGLKAMTPARVTARQIEAARRTITRHMKRTGRVWIRIFPDLPVSQKPAEVRQGKGKGTPEYWACRVKPGRIMFEVDGVTGQTARRAFELAAAKLPLGTRVVSRLGGED